MIAPVFRDRGALGTLLDGDWEFCAPPAGAWPEHIDALAWRQATVPGTAAAAGEHLDLDEREFLFRKRFGWSGQAPNASLVFDGLATFAEAWLNGHCVLSTSNMFRRYAVDVRDALRAENELVLRFRPLSAELARPFPRGRWATRLVKHRNLRRFRTTLLGRTQGWGRPLPPVGPWRGVRLLEGERVVLNRIRLQPLLEGSDGVLAVELEGAVLASSVPTALVVRLGDEELKVPVRAAEKRFTAAAELRLPDVVPWCRMT